MAKLEDVIDYISVAIEGCEAAGVDLIASDGEALLEGVSDHEQAAAELRELARLIELYGQESDPAEGEVTNVPATPALAELANAHRARLTEKELWSIFAENLVERTDSMGPTVERFKPDDYLRDPGNYGDMGDFANEVADGLHASDNPEDDIDCRIEAVEHYLDNLKVVKTAFGSLKLSNVKAN